jgi:hypothetical protein
MTNACELQGYPHWHQEVRLDDNPLEAGLLFTCKLKTSTDFLGRERLQQIRNSFFKFPALNGIGYIIQKSSLFIKVYAQHGIRIG